MRRIFHRVEVIQVTKEFIEAVNGWQELIPIAEMVLTKLAGRVPCASRAVAILDSLGRKPRFAPLGRPWSCPCELVTGP